MVDVDDPVGAFSDEARRFCALIEDHGSPNSWLFAQECLRLVLRLYERALLLPETGPATARVLDRVDHQAWQDGIERVRRRLVRDEYWEVFEPLEVEQPQPLMGSISDALVDIWRDIKEGLLEMDSGTPGSRNDAVWHWRFSFESHWAHHASDAIRALGALCFGQFADPGRPQDNG
jgi:Domain of unknown function (DUF5063)